MKARTKLARAIRARNGWKQRLHIDPLMVMAQRAIRASPMTYSEIGRVSGLATTTISKIDNDKTLHPQGLSIYCILRACGVKIINV